MRRSEAVVGGGVADSLAFSASLFFGVLLIFRIFYDLSVDVQSG
jgi:hypothetical protein